MKRQYETPEIEVVRFRYGDQVVAASGDGGGGPIIRVLIGWQGCNWDYPVSPIDE